MSRSIVMRIALAAVALVVIAGVNNNLARASVGLLGLLVFVGIAFSGRTVAILGVIVWLVALGFIRRLLIPFAGWTSNDPLLLMSPAAAIVLLVATRGDRPPPRTLLSSLVLFQLLWAVASIANPGETNLLLAVQAAMFFIVPMLWFFVGRRLTVAEHDRVLATVQWLLVPVVLLGLWHTFVGLLPFEYRWLSIVNNPTLFVGGFHVRPFSTFVSPQEYGMFLMLGALALWAAFLHGERRHPGWKLLFFATVMALFLQSSRGLLLAFAATAVVLLAVRRRSLSFILISAALLFVALSPLVSRAPATATNGQFATPAITNGSQPLLYKNATKDTSTATALVQHEIDGLLHPSESTAPAHLDLYVRGLSEGLHNPLGLGPSVHSLARSRTLRDNNNTNSPESQFPTVISALGILPGLALLLMYLIGMVSAWRLYFWRPSGRHLAWIGLLFAAGDQALNGQMYATSVLLALTFGGISVEYAKCVKERRQVVRPRNATLVAA